MATELHALLAECPLTLSSPQSSLTQPSGLLQCQGVATEKEILLIADVAVYEQTNGVCLNHETSVGNSTATKHSE